MPILGFKIKKARNYGIFESWHELKKLQLHIFPILDLKILFENKDTREECSAILFSLDE